MFSLNLGIVLSFRTTNQILEFNLTFQLNFKNHQEIKKTFSEYTSNGVFLNL